MYSSDCHDRPGLTHCRIVVFAFLSLIVLIFLVYSNSFHCAWHFDDFPNIHDNPNIHMTEISWHSIKSALFSDRNNPHIPARPVACMTFALNYYFGSLNVLGYHLVNILIHFMSSFFLFLFIYRSLSLPTLKEKYERDAYLISLLATVLWAINPIQTQAITYIVQRETSLAAMFYIMGMYFFLRARTHGLRSKRIFFFALCGTSFLLAMGSKENAAMFPISLLLFEVLVIQKNPTRFLRTNMRKLGIALGAVLCFALIYLYIDTGSLLSVLKGYNDRPFTLGQRLLTEPRIIIYYLTLLFYPMPNRLSIVHDFPISTSLFHPISTFLCILAIFAIIAGALLLAKKRPLISFCVLFFFLNHVIESSIIPLELVFEHRNYLPSMFLFLPVAIGFSAILEIYKNKPVMKSILSGFIILVLIGLGHSTFMRNFTWENEKSLWIDAVNKAPNLYRPRHNLANAYQNDGELEKAISEYNIALKKPITYNNSGKFITYYNMGQLYFEKKEYKQAIAYYRKSISLNPTFPDAYTNLAVVMDLQGEHHEAQEYLHKALFLNPSSIEVRYDLGLDYLEQDQPDKAISNFQQALKDKDMKIRATEMLGIAYKQKDNLGRAIVYFKQALEKNPHNIIVRLHLAEIYYRLHDLKEARNETKNVLVFIRDKHLLDQTLDRIFLKDTGRQRLMPDPQICVTLLSEVLKDREKQLKRWGKQLDIKAKNFIEANKTGELVRTGFPQIPPFQNQD